MSRIEWTDETWNPLRGCRRVSPGCEHCYAERQAARPILSGPGKPYDGLVAIGQRGPRWTGVSSGPDHLDVPLRWREPRRVFVCSMSDLFFEEHDIRDIAKVFAIMARAGRHTFQVLTKRPERAAEWLNDPAFKEEVEFWIADDMAIPQAPIRWPLPNVWIGTSVEDQQRAEERLPHLLRCPAALRFVSAEPLLEEVDLSRWLDASRGTATRPHAWLQWVIVGGESGPGARPFDLAWARKIRDQCAAAGTAYFFKQAGANVVQCAECNGEGGHYTGVEHMGHREFLVCKACGGEWRNFADKKGGDLDELPLDLRIRQWPEVRRG